MAGTTVSSLMGLTEANDSETFSCRGDLPLSQESLQNLHVSIYVIMALVWVAVLAIFAIYIEEIYFILKNFKVRKRRERTIYILGLFPAYALCAALGIMIPRAATLVDLIADAYFATCLYNVVRLFGDYTGDVEEIADTLEDPMVSLRGPPCCCCCVCLPTVKFSFPVFRKMVMLVLQTAVIRPVLLFIAAVLWTDGAYIPGMIAADNGYIYITIITTISSLLATYGLLLIARTLGQPLVEFALKPKVFSVQLVLVGTVLGSLLISILSAVNVIPCTNSLPSRARGDRVYHAYLVFYMLLVSLFARMAYRRSQDGYNTAKKSTSSLNTARNDPIGSQTILTDKEQETPNHSQTDHSEHSDHSDHPDHPDLDKDKAHVEIEAQDVNDNAPSGDLSV